MSQRLHPSTPRARAFGEYDRVTECLNEARFNLQQTEHQLQLSESRADSYRRQLRVALFLCASSVVIAVMWGAS